MGILDNRTFRAGPAPVVRVPGAFLNLGCGHDIRPVDAGWTNLDGFVDHKDVLRWDVLKTPWPLNDDAFDAVCASHVLEHIPTRFRLRDGVERDILFDVMEEIHRVLKPGGILHLRTPWAGSRQDFAHPQHYRHWRPEWFGTFHPDGAENYYSTARFTVHSWRRNLFGVRGANSLRFGASGLGLTDHLAHRVPLLRPLLMERGELEAFLVAVKAQGSTDPA